MSNKSFNYILESKYNRLNDIQKELMHKAHFRILQNGQNADNRIEFKKQDNQSENKLTVYYDEINKNISVQIDILSNEYMMNEQACLNIANKLIKIIKKAIKAENSNEIPSPVFIIPLKKKKKKDILVESLCG